VQSVACGIVTKCVWMHLCVMWLWIGTDEAAEEPRLTPAQYRRALLSVYISQSTNQSVV